MSCRMSSNSCTKKTDYDENVYRQIKKLIINNFFLEKTVDF